MITFRSFVLLWALLGSVAFAGGSLKVSITPAAAVSAGARWRVDGGAWQTSGATVKGLFAGTHNVEFKPVAGWIAPAMMPANVVNSRTTTLSAAYVQAATFGVQINPSGGQWRIDGGAWLAGGATTQLMPGTYQIEYLPLTGYRTPPAESVTLQAGQSVVWQRTYAQYGQLSVTLNHTAGRWRIDGGVWLPSGIVHDLLPGEYQIEYLPLSYWEAPAAERVVVAAGALSSLQRAYTRLGQVTVALVPSHGQWRLNGGDWQASGASLWVPAGTYTIDYLPLPEYDTPPPDTFANGFAATRYYTSQRPTLRVSLAPTTGKWRVDGGSWQNSGATVAELSVGAHSVDYLDLGSPYQPLASETVSLELRQKGHLLRSYALRPASLTVALNLANAQWRVDGGAWQPAGATLTGLTQGAHRIEYSSVAYNIPPPAETITLTADTTTQLARDYTASGEVAVVATPSSVSRVGASFRVDGGPWINCGTSTPVAPGSHVISFLPVNGLSTPDSQVVDVALGETTTVQAAFTIVHRLRFFLHQDLVSGIDPSDLKYRIAQYADHVRTIFHRESVRRFTFDPESDITVCAANPATGYYVGTLPEIGYEVWVYADRSTTGYTNGGYTLLDVSGAGGATGMHWDAVYDPATVPAGSAALRQYWTQITTIVHEIEHDFGAGLGEYYSPGWLTDPTNVAPILPMTAFSTPGESDHFWGSRTEYWADPLLVSVYDHWRLGNPRSIPELLQIVTFAPATKGVLAGLYRRNPVGTLPDLSRTVVRVVDADTGELVAGATVRAWNRRVDGTYGHFEQTVTATETPGVYLMNWTPYPTAYVLSNYDNMKIIKAWAPGYVPTAQWEWAYDAQKAKCVDGKTSFEVTVRMRRE